MEADKLLNQNRQKNIKNIDRYWFFTFVGTAIGAGILFAPVLAGRAGALIFLLSLSMAFSVTYYAQKYFCIVLIKAEKVCSYNETIKAYWGRIAATIISIAFSIQLLVTLLIYSKGLIGGIINLLSKNSLPVNSINQEYLFSFIIILILASFLFFSDKFLIKMISRLTVLLIIAIVGISILLVPFWRFDSSFLSHQFDLGFMLNNFLMCFPLFIGTAVFYLVLSPMITFYKRNYPELSVEEQKVKILGINQSAIVALIFVIGLFIISSALTLTGKGIGYAFNNNASSLMTLISQGIYYAINNDISSLSLLGDGVKLTSLLNIIKFINYAIIVLALVTSFYGVSLGLIELFVNLIPYKGKWSYTVKKRISIVVIIAIVWLMTVFKIDLLDIISSFFNPCNGIFLFIIPTLIILTNKKLKKNRKVSTYIILLVGILSLFSLFLSNPF
jgi:serine transporter